MAKEKSKLMAKYANRAKKVHEKLVEKPVEYDNNASLPAGIEGGIAQFVEGKIALYEKGEMKGEPYIRMVGIMVAPEEHNGMKIKGLRTSFMSPLCDTPKSTSRPKFEDHLAVVYNELKKLGVEEPDASEFEEQLEALKELKPFFAVRTWAGKPNKEYPNPRVNEVWNGLVEYENSEESENAVEDDTEDTEDTEDTDEKDDTDEKENNEEIEETETENEDAEESEIKDVKVGQIYHYKPEGSKKQIEVEVLKVGEDKKTVTLRSIDNPGKKFIKIPIDELEEID